MEELLISRCSNAAERDLSFPCEFMPCRLAKKKVSKPVKLNNYRSTSKSFLKESKIVSRIKLNLLLHWTIRGNFASFGKVLTSNRNVSFHFNVRHWGIKWAQSWLLRKPFRSSYVHLILTAYYGFSNLFLVCSLFMIIRFDVN